MLRQIQLKFLSASADTLKKQKKSPRSELLFRDTIRTRMVFDSLTLASLEIARLSGKLGSLIRAKHYQYGDDFLSYE